MHRLIKSHRAANAGRAQHAERTDNCAGLVGKNVAKHIFGEQHIEVCRPRHQCHRGRIDIHVGELHVGIVLPNSRDDIAPQTRAIQNVGLIDGRHLAPPRSRQSKSHVRNAFDFRFAIASWCRLRNRFPGRALSRARLAEIKSAQQLADNQHVHASHHFRPQRRTIFKRRKTNCGTQIGKYAQRSGAIARSPASGRSSLDN